MLEAIYTGSEIGSGGGGGGSTNPTSGVMPVNILGTFLDSLVSSGTSVGNNTKISINDTTKLIQLLAGTSSIELGGVTDDVTIDGNNGVVLQGGVFINNHLGNAILRFLSNGASDPALKANGTILEVKNGNDTQFLGFRARDIFATGNINAIGLLVFDTKSIVSSSVDGQLTLTNNAGNNFTRLQLGGTTSAFPAIARNGAGVQIVLADGSAVANLQANAITGSSNITTDANLKFGITTGKSQLSSPADSTITLLNNAGTDFKFLQFGGTAASFPMLSKLSTGIAVRRADDSADLSLTALDLTASGKVTTAADFSVALRSVLTSLADSNFTLYNAAKTAFSLLQFGGISNAFPALKRNATALNVRLADDSGDAALTAAAITSSGAVTASTNFFSSTANLLLGVSGATSIIRGSTAGVQIAASAGAANASAQLEIVSTTRGFLPPRMTDVQRLAIVTPAQGLMVYQTNTNGAILEGLYIYKSTGWVFVI